VSSFPRDICFCPADCRRCHTLLRLLQFPFPITFTALPAPACTPVALGIVSFSMSRSNAVKYERMHRRFAGFGLPGLAWTQVPDVKLHQTNGS
jgi:hypothetical protein